MKLAVLRGWCGGLTMAKTPSLRGCIGAAILTLANQMLTLSLEFQPCHEAIAATATHRG